MVIQRLMHSGDEQNKLRVSMTDVSKKAYPCWLIEGCEISERFNDDPMAEPSV